MYFSIYDQSHFMNTKAKLFYEVVIIFVISRLIFAIENNIIIRITKKLFPEKSFIDLVNQWDSTWYIGIIKHGYMLSPLTQPLGMVGQADWAFFPLLPLFAKALYLLGMPAEWCGIVVNQIAFLLSLWIFYLILLEKIEMEYARFGVLIFALTPFNIFVSASYSDTLFMLFSLLAFYNLSHKNYWWAAICGGFLSATRFFGIVFLLVYLYDAYVSKRKLKLVFILQIILISSGLLLFMSYLHYHINDALAFYHIQKAWGHMGVDWLRHPINAIDTTFMSGQTYAKWFLILSLLWIPYLIYKKMYNYAIFSASCLLAPIAVGTLWSFTRYSLSLFTFYIVVAMIASRSQYLRYLILMLTVVLHFGFYLLWMTGDAAVL